MFYSKGTVYMAKKSVQKPIKRSGRPKLEKKSERRPEQIRAKREERKDSGEAG